MPAMNLAHSDAIILGLAEAASLTMIYTTETDLRAATRIDAYLADPTLRTGGHTLPMRVAESTTIVDAYRAVATGTRAAASTAIGAASLIAFGTCALAEIRVVGLVGRAGVGDAHSLEGTKHLPCWALPLALAG